MENTLDIDAIEMGVGVLKDSEKIKSTEWYDSSGLSLLDDGSLYNGKTEERFFL